MIEIVIPKDGVMGAQDIALVDIVGVGLASGRMSVRHIEEVEKNIGRDNLGNLNDIEALEAGHGERPVDDILERAACSAGEVWQGKEALEPRGFAVSTILKAPDQSLFLGGVDADFHKGIIR